MPKLPAHVLIWTIEKQSYILHTPEHPLQSIQPGNEDAWQAWLENHSSFSFQGRCGHLNVLKESRARGAGYWYAYHTSSGRNRKRYLGTGAGMTLARLEEVAQILQEVGRERIGKSVQREEDVLQMVKEERVVYDLPETAADGVGQTVHVGNEKDTNHWEPDNEFMMMVRLSPPRLPATLVVRERLLTMLDSALSRPLTLLSASAGWGKTTLLAAWAGRQQGVVAWLSLEAMDNDPTRFWMSLIMALRRCWPEIGARALALLQATASAGSSLSTVLTVLLNELTDRGRQNAPIVLILDDYHVITEPMIHSSLTLWLEHLPPHVHLLLASRIDPDLPLARLRVRSLLGEIRDTDLRFTLEEAHNFLIGSMGLDLADSDVALVEARTEGWIASLQLAALFLQKQTDLAAGVQTLSGNQRFLLDYLREEILANLTSELQDFLLQTSGLERLSASLCDAVRGREDSVLLLEQVERANLFLQVLDEKREWYRYHALWVQAMQHEARLRLGADAVRAMHGKASHWYEQQQMLPEAIEAALMSEDFARTEKLLKRFVVPNSFHNEYRLLYAWFRRMPDEELQSRPELSFLCALALMITTDRHSTDMWMRAEQLLQWAQESFEARGQWEQLGEALQLHADLAFFQEDLLHLFALGDQARPLLTEQSLMYPDHLVLRGLEAWLTGEVEMASQYLLQGYEREKNLHDHSSAFVASLLLGNVYLEKGKLRRASFYYQQALDSIDLTQEMVQQQFYPETGSTESFFLSWGEHCLAQLAYERNELEEAKRYLMQAGTLREKPEQEIHALASGSFIQARLLFAIGEVSQALNLLAIWERRARYPQAIRSIRACRARMDVASGDLVAVEQWIEEKKLVSDTRESGHEQHFLLLEQEEALMQARLGIAQKRGAIVLQELAPWKEQAQTQGRGRSVLEIQILEALAYAACQEHRQATIAIMQALRLALPQNFQRVFVDEGPAMEALLKMVLPEIREASLMRFVRTLLRAFVQESSVRLNELPAERGAKLPLEPLSEQEQRVLRLLAVGRTNPEIARELVISVNTVKTHVQNLYRKLDSRNRVEAGEVARRLSIL